MLMGCLLLGLSLPRVGGVVVFCALVCTGCRAAANGDSLGAAIWFLYGVVFGASPLYFHHRFHSPRGTTQA